MLDFATLTENVGKTVDAVGVAVIIFGGIVAIGAYLLTLRHDADWSEQYRTLRRSLGRAILLGLEFLVAGDIIRTIAVSPTFRQMGVLAIIVAIRTFLSFSLELEISGRWPWEKKPTVEQQPSDAA